MSTQATCRACSGPSHDGPDAACPALVATPAAAAWPRWYALEERAAIIEYEARVPRLAAQVMAKLKPIL